MFALGLVFTAGSIYAFVAVGQIPNVFPRPEQGCPLITSGFFGAMRHPGYLGNVSLFIGGSLGLGCLYGFISAVVLLPPFYYCKAAQEEVYLAESFGDEWTTYTRRVP